MTISESARFRRSSTVVSREIASETLVVPIRGGVGDLDAIFSFNPVGSDLWMLMEKETSVGEMAAWIAERYEVGEAQAKSDIREFLNELLQAGLVQPAEVVPKSLEPMSGTYASC
ncbi:MAG TPA: PqqD family protein [Dongiaceae bacterium]|nr:PqqD family protein [Dongiaceae bacterium]